MNLPNYLSYHFLFQPNFAVNRKVAELLAPSPPLPPPARDDSRRFRSRQTALSQQASNTNTDAQGPA